MNVTTTPTDADLEQLSGPLAVVEVARLAVEPQPTVILHCLTFAAVGLLAVGLDRLVTTHTKGRN